MRPDAVNNQPGARPRGRAAGGRAGFSFVEVLFAVMILGIGFIMLAGIFPVAISQTQSTGEETNAANVGRSAAAYLSKLSGTKRVSVFVPDGRVRRFDTTAIPPDVTAPGPSLTLWERVRGNLIVPEDRRYAWVPLYRRWSSPAPPGVFPPTPRVNDFAEVTIVVLRVRNHSEYGPEDLVVNNNRGTLIPRDVRVTLRERDPDPDRITIDGNDHPVTPGTYVVIAQGSDVSGRNATGRIYRVGNAVAEGNRNEYDLAPGNDMQIIRGPGGILKEDVDNVEAYVIGEGVAPGGGYFGGAQDVGIYTTYVKLNP